jgi:predicted RNA-binding Zn-ribbon protein involved in translation (DUF1610 family)
MAYCPSWVPLSVLGPCTLLTGFPLWRRRTVRKRRREQGQCVACGYDLRGAAHERCPECGENILVAPARV